MKTITIAVPEEEVKSFEAFLRQSKITIIEENENDFEISVSIFEFDTEEIHQRNSKDFISMKELEKDLEAEIWKLHHFEE